MGILSRTLLKETAAGALLGTTLFTFILFLRSLGRLFEQLVTSRSDLDQIGALFLLIIPPALTFTIPVGVLVGALIALGRMSGDGEIIAMRAAGIPSRRLLIPILLFSFAGFCLAFYTSCFLTPWATRETYRILNQIGAAQLTAEIRPRIFEEQFPNRVLYVEDVVPGPVVRWKRVLIADMRPPAERDGAGERGEGPRITLALEALATPDLAQNRIQLSLLNQSSFEVGKDPAEYFSTAAPRGEQALDAPRRSEQKARDFQELEMLPLYKQAKVSVEAAIEFHRRLALPVACLILGALAVPLGVTSRKGGKSSAFAWTVGLAFLYYMGLISAIAVARQGALPPGISVWLPNLLFLALTLVLLTKVEAPSDREWGSGLRDVVATIARRLVERFSPGQKKTWRQGATRFPLVPQIIDTYVLSAFFYYFVALVAAFVLMTHVFTFFELLGDIIKTRTPMPRVGTFHFFLSPLLIYDSAPMAVLVAVLITFSLLSRTNEITAFKACGISAYRLTAPILIAGFLLSGGLFAFDYYIVPEANLIQDAIRNEIKGRPPQTFLSPNRKWIFGRGPWIYHYKHFDSSLGLMAGVSVFEIDRNRFELRRHIYADTARWEPSLKRWVFQNGWMRRFQGIRVVEFQDFRGLTATFPHLEEPPTHFLMEGKQDKQMNFQQLAAYIRELQQSGIDTLKLQVQYHKKFSVPLFALIMALLSAPFAFFSGTRGAMAPVGIALGIAICYLTINRLFEQLGNFGQLSPEFAAWSPDLIFGLAGLYLLMRVRT
ncbi:MAG: LptF/LptG family permease [Bryobacteraceae bacterium]|nr:LptF/LptG family permease [Bryobacteraceae bacterium]MDW8378544.1 LptF/LptG family permease [Bryobacterales bacterium]